MVTVAADDTVVIWKSKCSACGEERMNYLIYNVLLGLASLFLTPYYAWRVCVTGKYRKSMGPKFGVNPAELFSTMKGTPRIWVHAVSVGEVTAAAPIVEALRARYPGSCIVLSTSTETGQDAAVRLVPHATSHFYYPLDIPCIINKVLDGVAPDVFVPVETEIWPNFIRACQRRAVRVVMVNGRISPRSFKKYRSTRFFWREILKKIDAVGVISGTDAERITAMGMDSARVPVLGNAKYDSLAAGADPVRAKEMARLLSLSEGTPVFVAGSTHGGEDKAVIDAYNSVRHEFPDLILLLVPRHIERVREIENLLAAEGLDHEVIRFSEISGGSQRGERRIVLVDAMGVLFSLYGCAHVVFCGGSLVPRGGQNVLEAAAWGKVVFFGPHMEDFIHERDQLLGSGAGITVTNAQGLAAGIKTMLKDPEERRRCGEAGKEMVQKNRGAAARYADLIASVLS